MTLVALTADARPPSPTVTKTPVPIFTPLPTLLDPVKAIYRLYDTNGGCRLPCWWGITPGSSSWEDTLRFFSQFGELVVIESGWPCAHTCDPPGENFRAFYPPKRVGIDYFVSTLFRVRDGKVVMITVDGESMRFAGISPTLLIRTYGLPDRALSSRFSLVLLYQDEGILAVYQPGEIPLTPSFTCFDGYVLLTLWATPEEWTDQRLRAELADPELSPTDPASLLVRSWGVCLDLP